MNTITDLERHSLSRFCAQSRVTKGKAEISSAKSTRLSNKLVKNLRRAVIGQDGDYIMTTRLGRS